jgi:hypothetical protein
VESPFYPGDRHPEAGILGMIWVERTTNYFHLSVKQRERESPPSIIIIRKPNGLQESG